MEVIAKGSSTIRFVGVDLSWLNGVRSQFCFAQRPEPLDQRVLQLGYLCRGDIAHVIFVGGLAIVRHTHANHRVFFKNVDLCQLRQQRFDAFEHVLQEIQGRWT